MQVREDLDGCLDDGLEKCDVWYLALDGLKNMDATLDDANLDRLFWRDKRMVSSTHLEGEPPVQAPHQGCRRLRPCCIYYNATLASASRALALP